MFLRVLCIAVCVCSVLSGNPLEPFVNEVLPNFYPVLTAALSDQLKAYDPFDIPRETFSSQVDVQICTATASATMQKGSVGGLSSLAFQNATLQNAKLAANGVDYSGQVVVKLTGKMSGAAQIRGSFKTCIPTPYGPTFNGPEVSDSATATIYADVSAEIVMTVTTNALQALKEQCVGQLIATSMTVTSSNLRLSLSFKNPIFNVFSSIVEKYVKPVLMSKVNSLSNSLSSLVLPAIDKKTAVITCPSTSPPTNIPYNPMTDPPTALPSPLEKILSGLFSAMTPTLTIEIQKSLASYDPLTLPVSSASYKQTVDLGLCSAEISVKAKSASVNGASSMTISQVSVSNSTISTSKLVADVSLYFSALLSGVAAMTASGECGSYASLTGDLNATFNAKVGGYAKVRVEADLLQILKSRCVSKVAPLTTNLVLSGLSVSVTSTNPIFNTLAPAVTDYFMPALQNAVGTMQGAIETVLFGALDQPAAVTCKPTDPPTPVVTAKPTTAPPTAALSPLDKLLNELFSAMAPTLTTEAQKAVASYDPTTLPTSVASYNQTVDLGQCQAEFAVKAKSATVTGASSMIISRVASSNSTISKTTMTADVKIYFSAPLFGVAAMTAHGECGSIVSLSGDLDAKFNATAGGYVLVKVVADPQRALQGKCVSKVAPQDLTLTLSGLSMSVSSTNPLFNSLAPAVTEYVKPVLQNAVSTMQGAIETVLFASLTSPAAVICPPIGPLTTSPTSKPTAPTSASPTKLPNPFEDYINPQFAQMIPALNKDAKAAVVSFDPFRIPVPANPFEKEVNLLVCEAKATVTVLNGAVSGANKLNITQIVMTNTSMSDPIVGDATVKFFAPLTGVINLEANASCLTINLNSSVVASFTLMIEGDYLIRLTLSLARAATEQCVDRAENLDFTMSYSDLKMTLKATNPIFDAFSDIVLGYVQPELTKQITGMQDVLKTQLFNANLTESLVCASLSPTTLSPTAAPTGTLSPTLSPTTAPTGTLSPTPLPTTVPTASPTELDQQTASPTKLVVSSAASVFPGFIGIVTAGFCVL